MKDTRNHAKGMKLWPLQLAAPIIIALVLILSYNSATAEVARKEKRKSRKAKREHVKKIKSYRRYVGKNKPSLSQKIGGIKYEY